MQADMPANRPRVLFIGPYPPPYSGPELGMKLFLESSLAKQFAIRFIKTNHRTDNAQKARLDLATAKAFFLFFSRLLYELMRHRPEAVYYPVTPTEMGWLGRDAPCLMLCHLFRARTIIHLRGGHLQLNLRTFTPLTRRLAAIACRRVSLALVQAERLRNQFDGLVPRDRVAVLDQAIDVHEYDNPDLGAYDPNQVLFLGNLTKAKGYCDLVRAIPLVAARLPGARFVFAGTLHRGERGVFFDQTSGTPLEYEDPFLLHEHIGRSEWQRNYSFVGIVRDGEKLGLLRNSALFVLPSYSEGFSRALLEAMAVGKPVVCTPVGAHPEVIEDGVNGLFVNPGDVEALAERIAYLLGNPSVRHRMAEANYRLVRRVYDIDIVAARLGAYIQDVINGQDEAAAAKALVEDRPRRSPGASA